MDKSLYSFHLSQLYWIEFPGTCFWWEVIGILCNKPRCGKVSLNTRVVRKKILVLLIQISILHPPWDTKMGPYPYVIVLVLLLMTGIRQISRSSKQLSIEKSGGQDCTICVTSSQGSPLSNESPALMVGLFQLSFSILAIQSLGSVIYM